MNIFLAVVVAVIFYVLYRSSSQSAENEIHAKFGLSNSKFKLISTDLGGKNPKLRLSAMGVGGIPDAVFESRKSKVIVVGEMKARKLKGGVRLMEFYQVIIYIGLLRQLYPNHAIEGILGYNGALVRVAHDQELFNALIGLRAEILTSLKNKKPSNPRPLHKRIQVRLPR